MKLKTYLLVVNLSMSFAMYGQKINITLPSEANKEYVFLLHKGINADTVQRGTFSFLGGLTIDVPQKYKDYKGMASLWIKDSPPLNLVINHENFLVSRNTDNGWYVFENSAENKYLYSVIQDKAGLPEDSSLYASGFINIVHYKQLLNRVAGGAGGLRERNDVRSYAVNELDMENLYTSGFWYGVVDALTKVLGTQQMFGQDMVKILMRIKSQEVFEHLAGNLITITEQYGWDDAFDIIVPYIEKSGRIPVPQGKMYTAFILSKVRKGMEAPKIAGLSQVREKSKTLLVFYMPDCENCHAQIDQLLSQYEEIKAKGVRVVTISGDNDKKTFEQDCLRFPWPDKLCDFKGYSGENFINYGILGTPTFFLLDTDNVVIKRFAQISDLTF
jgi:peroxiredoxin